MAERLVAQRVARPQGVYPVLGSRARFGPEGRTQESPVDDSWRRKAFGVLVVLIWLRMFLPGALNFWAQRHVSLDVGQTAIRTHQSTLAGSALFALIALCCVWICLRTLGDRTAPLAPIVPVGAYMALQFADRVWRGDVDARYVYVLGASMLCLVAVARLKPGVDQLRILGVLGATTAAYCLASGHLRPQYAYFGDNEGRLRGSVKAIVGSDQLAGVFGHSNTLGIYCALSLPFCFLLSGRSMRILASTLVVGGVLESASRSSLLAVVIVLAAATVMRHSGRAAVWTATLGLLLTVSVMVCLPFLEDDPDAFTRRGGIWITSLEQWRGNPLLGLGSTWYDTAALHIKALGEQATSGHNLLVSWLATGGLVLAAVGSLIFVRLGSVCIEYARSGERVPALHLLAFLVISITEFIWVLELNTELFVVTGLVFTSLLVAGYHSRRNAEFVRPRRGRGL